MSGLLLRLRKQRKFVHELLGEWLPGSMNGVPDIGTLIEKAIHLEPILKDLNFDWTSNRFVPSKGNRIPIAFRNSRDAATSTNQL